MSDRVESCVADREKTYLLGSSEARREKMMQSIGFDRGATLAGLRQEIERQTRLVVGLFPTGSKSRSGDLVDAGGRDRLLRIENGRPIATPVEPIADDETAARICGMRQWQPNHPGGHTVPVCDLPQRQTPQTRRRVGLLDQQAKTNERLRKEVVGQDIDGDITLEGSIARIATNTVMRRPHAGHDRCPHWLRLRRPRRRQMHRSTAIEQPSKIR